MIPLNRITDVMIMALLKRNVIKEVQSKASTFVNTIGLFMLFLCSLTNYPDLDKRNGVFIWIIKAFQVKPGIFCT